METVRVIIKIILYYIMFIIQSVIFIIFRANDENALETSSSVTLAPLWVEDAVIGLEAKMPAHGWVRTPFCISYFIKNHSDYLVTLRLIMEGSDAFMFAGQKQVCGSCLYCIHNIMQ